MEQLFKNKKGITLIVLVITIIVLLILAGVSIATLTGDNGLLTQSGKAKQNTERAQIIESAGNDIYEKQILNNGSISEEELEEILTSSEYSTQGTLSDNGEESILDKTLTSKDGKYQIPVKEIYNGILSNKKSLIKFTIDEIEYTVEDGTTWREWALDNNLDIISRLVPPPVHGDYVSTIKDAHGKDGAVHIDDVIVAGSYYSCTIVE